MFYSEDFVDVDKNCRKVVGKSGISFKSSIFDCLILEGFLTHKLQRRDFWMWKSHELLRSFPGVIHRVIHKVNNQQGKHQTNKQKGK